eukprot:506346_1
MFTMSTELNQFPSSHCSKPFVINDHEFIVATSKNRLRKGDGIYKFNTHKNEWTKIFNYNETFTCTIESVTYDNKNKLLYFSGKPDTHMTWLHILVIFDLENNEITAKQLNKTNFKLIFANNQLHQICYYNGDHCVYSDHYVYDSAKFQKLTTFVPMHNLYNYGLIYMKSKKSLLVFGGMQQIDVTNFRSGYVTKKSIYRFSCVDSKWKELKIKMPTKLSGFGLVATTNERYIIIL